MGAPRRAKFTAKNHSLAIHSDDIHAANLMPSEIAVSGGAQLIQIFRTAPNIRPSGECTG